MPAKLKAPATRQRRNKVSTAAEIPLQPLDRCADLPTHRKEWHPFVVKFWGRIWDSPMAAEFCQEDYFLLAVAFEGLQAFLEKPSIGGARVVSQTFAPFGLTPLDRRRLNWTFRRPEEPKEAEQPKASSLETRDPRDVLDGIH